MSGAKILVIDDEVPIRKLLRVTLQAQGFAVSEAVSGLDGLQRAGVVRPDIVILDLGLPDMEGIDVLKRLREWYDAPIIALTVKDREDDKVLAFDLGANDYVTKPFGIRELIARIRAALRPVHAASAEPVLRVGELTIDLAQRAVCRGGEPVRLTPTEYDLLRALAMYPGRVLTHKQLLQKVWGHEPYEDGSQYLRVYIAHLRKKLEENPARPELIVTEPGVGYRLADPESF